MPKIRMSKFDCALFDTSDRKYAAISMQRYTFDEAVKIASKMLGVDYVNASFAYNEAFVKHRAGVNSNGEKVVGWWIEHNPYLLRCCPCWIFPALDFDDFISMKIIGETFKEGQKC